MKSVYILTHISAIAWEGTYTAMLAVYAELPTAEVLTEHLRAAVTELGVDTDTPFEVMAFELLNSPEASYTFSSTEISAESVELRKIPTNTVLNV